jgi:hypothetical protein
MALDLPSQCEGKVPAAIEPLGQLVDCHVILEEHHALIDSEASGGAQEELLAPRWSASQKERASAPDALKMNGIRYGTIHGSRSAGQLWAHSPDRQR